MAPGLSERRDEPWREPYAEERALLEALLALGPSESESVKLDLLGRRVRSICLCPCGSLEFEDAGNAVGPGAFTELDAFAETRGSAGATLHLYRADGGRWTLSVMHLGQYGVIDVSSLALMQPGP